MIRRVALVVMILVLIILFSSLFTNETPLLGRVVAVQCEDSDLKDTNDPVGGTVFSREAFSTIHFMLAGRVTGIHPQFRVQKTMRDNCLSSTKVREFYCDVQRNLITWAEEKCPAQSKCHEGACVRLLCKDQDGFNVTQNSSVIYSSAKGGRNFVSHDYCESSSRVVEYVCQNYNIVKSGDVLNIYDSLRDLRRAVHYACPSDTVCKNGKCIVG